MNKIKNLVSDGKFVLGAAFGVAMTASANLKELFMDPAEQIVNEISSSESHININGAEYYNRDDHTIINVLPGSEVTVSNSEGSSKEAFIYVEHGVPVIIADDGDSDEDFEVTDEPSI